MSIYVVTTDSKSVAYVTLLLYPSLSKYPTILCLCYYACMLLMTVYLFPFASVKRMRPLNLCDVWALACSPRGAHEQRALLPPHAPAKQTPPKARENFHRGFLPTHSGPALLSPCDDATWRFRQALVSQESTVGSRAIGGLSWSPQLPDGGRRHPAWGGFLTRGRTSILHLSQPIVT